MIKSYVSDFAALRSTLSEQHVPGTDSEGDEMDTCRKRFLSTGDLKGARSEFMTVWFVLYLVSCSSLTLYNKVLT